jgi:hypothetical protein
MNLMTQEERNLYPFSAPFPFPLSETGLKDELDDSGRAQPLPFLCSFPLV